MAHAGHAATASLSVGEADASTRFRGPIPDREDVEFLGRKPETEGTPTLRGVEFVRYMRSHGLGSAKPSAKRPESRPRSFGGQGRRASGRTAELRSQRPDRRPGEPTPRPRDPAIAGFGWGMSPEPLATRLPRRRPPPRPPGGRRAGARPPQSGAQNAFPRRDRCFGSDPKGSRQGCANTPALEPVAGPRTAGSLPSTARASRTPRANGATRPKDVATPADKRKWAAHGSADGQSVHRTPMSFAHSSTAPSRSAEYRPFQPRRTGGGRPPMRRGFPSLRCLPSSRFRRNGRSKPRDDVTVQRPRIMPPQTVRPRYPPLNLYILWVPVAASSDELREADQPIGSIKPSEAHGRVKRVHHSAQ